MNSIYTRHNVLQGVTNRSSEVAFHKAKKKERKKRAVEGERIIFRPTVNILNRRFHSLQIQTDIIFQQFVCHIRTENKNHDA